MGVCASEMSYLSSLLIMIITIIVKLLSASIGHYYAEPVKTKRFKQTLSNLLLAVPFVAVLSKLGLL